MATENSKTVRLMMILEKSMDSIRKRAKPAEQYGRGKGKSAAAVSVH
jgi:hypothetical protein